MNNNTRLSSIDDELFLIDKDFLRLLDLEKEREVFCKIVSLDFNENPLEQIEGRVTQGSVSVDGTSAVRRTCSLSLVANELNIHDFYWGLNTKFKLYVGVKNTVKLRQPYHKMYSSYPDICWFKMGTYLISSFNTSQTTNQYSISIQGKDKMAMLNGEVGGVITPLSWDFGKIDTVNADGSIVTTDYLIKDIILESVHEHAQEPYWNIIINDLDDCGLELLEYRGDIPMYLLYNQDTDVVEEMVFQIAEDDLIPLNLEDDDFSKIIFNYRIIGLKDVAEEPTIFNLKGANDQVLVDSKGKPYTYSIMKAEYGDVIGYRTTDLTYAGDLISNVGESVTSMLDKIKDMLGDFEYFYDLDGRFVFQRKKTYIHSSFSTITNNDTTEKEIYVSNAAETSSCVYSFDNAVLVTSFSNSPNLSDVKNDFSIWGTRKGISGIEIPIHLRYAIDAKPWMYVNYEGNIYITPEGQENYDRLMQEYQEWLKQQQETTAEEAGKTVFKKIAVPEFLQKENGTSDWWDITNWADYYLLLTGQYPDQQIKEYGTEEFFGTITFPNGEIFSARNSGQLVIDLERDTHNLFYGNGPDVGTNGHKLGYKSVYDRPGQARQEYEYTNRSWNPTQHGFTNCYHTYKEFLYLDEHNNCQSFIYKPQIPGSILTEDMIEFMDTIIIEDLGLDENKIYKCDWREIIYQMSLDYNKYHHDEDFLIKVDQNNTLPDNTHIYLGGYTGYEEYYIDLNGFWRDLYNPYYTYSYYVTAPTETKYEANKENYFIYQSCTNMDYQDAIDAALAWKELCGGTFYFCNYKNQKSPLDSPPNEELYSKHPENYCFVRRCDSLAPADKEYLQALPYDKRQTYFVQEEGDYVKKPKDADKDAYNPLWYWNTEVTENPEGLNFWFDFLDTESELAQYKVCKIGDRAKANNDTNVKSIYFRDVPTVIFVDPDTDIAAEQEKKGTGYSYVKLPDYLENLFSLSSQGKSAMDVLDDWLYQYAYCAESITMNALPVYYLEPNTRVLVRDDNSGINGEYIITRLTFPLTHNGTMSISATKAVENLY